MSHKSIRILYWIITGLFAAFMFFDGIVKIGWPSLGAEITQQLGYPLYLLTILGIANLLGSLALVQQKCRTLTEWAYAGFTIYFIGASLSHVFSGDSVAEIISPLIFLAVLLFSYYLWKERHRTLLNLSVNI